MKLSSKGRYGLNAMYHMALNNSLTTLKELSETTAVPQPYLEKLLGLLKKGGLVTTERGVAGGYKLSKAPSETTIGEILRVLENDLAFAECSNSAKCGNLNCPNQNIFRVVYDRLNSVLDDLTLQDMINKNKGEN